MAMNLLARESSPYLQQHASNPVHWHPWGESALKQAKDEDRPILLSIGYSSCHWCHVMERESFEDPATAALMNDLFVNIKVDREERPDIDQIYMKAVQAMTGSGGWPLTVWLTPDAIPFYGGTYFPPVARHGIPSFSQVLKATADAYQNRREAVVTAGRQLVEAIAKSSQPSRSERVDASLLDTAYGALARRYDDVHGGFTRAPKFPQPVTLELMLRHRMRTGDAAAEKMVVHTLRRMAAGGLRDHLAGGFHRYSVDAEWLVPHFEKMLYDNALLARAYLDAYRLTGNDDLRDVAEQTLEYLLDDMRSPEGGFYAARDADSEGEEGLFYVWTAREIESVLEPDDARLFMRAYDVSTEGNFEGRSILHLPHDLRVVAATEGIEMGDLQAVLGRARDALLRARSLREPPFRDEKILVSWNAMTLRALAEAGATVGRWDFVAAATAGADFLWGKLRRDGQLMHTYKSGEAKIPAFLDDHAAFGNALLSLHAATLDTRWLGAARQLCEDILERFWDPEEEVLFDTSADGEALVLRPRDPMDNAIPSGTSLTSELMGRAGHVFGDERLTEASAKIVRNEAGSLARFGPAFGRLLSSFDRSLGAPVEVAIVGDPSDDRTRALIEAAHQPLLTNVTIVGRSPDAKAPGVPLLEDRAMVDGAPTAYVCRRYSCRLPVTTPGALTSELLALSES